MFHPLSVKSKAALVSTAGVLLLFAAFTLFQLRHIRTEMQTVLGAQQFTLISSIADELDDKIRSTHRALIVTAEATTPEMLADLAAMERSLRGQPGYRSLFDDVFLIRRNGRVLIDLPVLKRRGIDVQDRDYFRRTLDTRKPVISEPYVGRGPVKEPAVMMTAPILDRSGEVVGILSGNIHPLKANVLGKLREARVGATGRFILFSRDRTIIVSREPDRIMTKGPEPGVTPYLDHAMAGREGWEESVNSRGERALYSYKQLASVPWVLVAALPVEEAYAPIAAAQARAVGIAALLALLLAPLVWFGMQYVLSPIGVLRELSAHHESVREEERARIAREIHDELGQALTALKMDLSMLGMKFGEGNPEIKTRAQELRDTVDRTIQVVRNVATALRPAVLDFGIVPAVEGLVEEFQKRSGIHCTVRFLGTETRFAEDRSIVIFRILQESLTNISRHAGAKNVQITVGLDATHFHLEVKDDGCGFDVEAVGRRKTFGLLGIRERVIMLRGELSIRSSPGAGTEVSVSIPYQ